MQLDNVIVFILVLFNTYSIMAHIPVRRLEVSEIIKGVCLGVKMLNDLYD